MARTWRPRGRVISWATLMALLILVGTAALVSAVTAPGKPSAKASANSTPQQSEPPTMPVSSTVPTSSPVPASIPVPTALPPPMTSTPTTVSSLAVCQASQFVATATADGVNYAPGQVVNITVSLRDTSTEPCSDTTNLIWQGGCVPSPGWGASASATNRSGQVV